MNKLQKWLLRKLIRLAVQTRNERLVVNTLWDACKGYYYEDNLPCRYDYIERMILVEYDKDMEECQRLST